MEKKITILIITIVITLIILSTTTYTLFFKQDKLANEENYTAGILDIVLENDEEGLGEVLNLVNSIPLTDEEGKVSKPYKFKITNKGNLTYTFDLKMLSTTISNQIDSRYIKVMIDDKEPVCLSSLASSIIASDLTLNPQDSKIISVRLWLDEYTPNSQIGKVFSAKIVGDGKGSEYVKPTNRTSSEMLEYLGFVAKVVTPDFSKTATTDEGIYAAVDDYGTSYYFRGTTTKNYVKFAGYYFRIIRINGDGSIRMIYDGTVAHSNGESSSDRQIGTSKFKDNIQDGVVAPASNYKKDVVSLMSYHNNFVESSFMESLFPVNTYVGYMYGNASASTYEETHANNNDSTIKTVVDNWYKINIAGKGYNEQIADVIYCNDRELNKGTGVGTVTTYYKSYQRLGNTKSPTLICTQQNDAFTVEDTTKGNGALTYPVGLMTADEVVMAGGTGHNSYYYLYTGENYWTMSPYYYLYSYPYVMLVSSKGNLVYTDSVNIINSVRPVISLKSSLEFTGNGTIDQPFEVK